MPLPARSITFPLSQARRVCLSTGTGPASGFGQIYATVDELPKRSSRGTEAKAFQPFVRSSQVLPPKASERVTTRTISIPDDDRTRSSRSGIRIIRHQPPKSRENTSTLTASRLLARQPELAGWSDRLNHGTSSEATVEGESLRSRSSRWR